MSCTPNTTLALPSRDVLHPSDCLQVPSGDTAGFAGLDTAGYNRYPSPYHAPRRTRQG